MYWIRELRDCRPLIRGARMPGASSSTAPPPSGGVEETIKRRVKDLVADFSVSFMSVRDADRGVLDRLTETLQKFCTERVAKLIGSRRGEPILQAAKRAALAEERWERARWLSKLVRLGEYSVRFGDRCQTHAREGLPMHLHRTCFLNCFIDSVGNFGSDLPLAIPRDRTSIRSQFLAALP